MIENLEEVCKQYFGKLYNTFRKPDFITPEGIPYFNTKDEPRLKGLWFYLKDETITVIAPSQLPQEIWQI